MAKADDERASSNPAPLIASHFKRGPKVNPMMESTSEKKREHVRKVYTFHCNVEGSTLPVVVTLSTKETHTIRWAEDFRTTLQQTDFHQRSKDDGRPACDPAERETLPAGSCNLYAYPNITFDHSEASIRKQRSGKRTAAQLLEVQHALLAKLFLVLFKQDGFADRTDASGATPLLALQVGNQPAAVSLCRNIFRQNPESILAKHSDGPFKGENAVHVFIVNEHEDAVLEMIELVCSAFRGGHLQEWQLQELFCGQAEGKFFNDLPMRHYGGTVLGFATAFSMTRVVYAMLKAATPGEPLYGIITLNGKKNACKLTGFLPVHVAIANGLTAMYEFLTNLPDVDHMYEVWEARHSKAIEHASKAGVPPPTFRPTGAAFRHAREHYAVNEEVCRLLVAEDSVLTLDSVEYGHKFKGLRPLQLCAKLGDQRMLQYCLRHKAKVRAPRAWAWRPPAPCSPLARGAASSTLMSRQPCTRLPL
jgi:hypothetical protein